MHHAPSGAVDPEPEDVGARVGADVGRGVGGIAQPRRIERGRDDRLSLVDRAIKETDRRRAVQVAYNREHGIEPTTIVKAIREIGMRLRQAAETEGRYERGGRPIAAGGTPKDELVRLIKDLERDMKTAAKDLEFERAATLRDEVVELRGQLVLERGPEGMLGEAKTTRRVVRRRKGI